MNGENDEQLGSGRVFRSTVTSGHSIVAPSTKKSLDCCQLGGLFRSSFRRIIGIIGKRDTISKARARALAMKIISAPKQGKY